MTQDFGHGACRIGGWKVETGGAVGRDQDTRGSFQPRTFHRAGIVMWIPFMNRFCAALPGTLRTYMVSKGGDIKACAASNGQNFIPLTRVLSPLP